MLRATFIVGLALSSCLVASGQTAVSVQNPVVQTLSLTNVRALSPAEQQRLVRELLNQVGAEVHKTNGEFFNEIAERVRFEFQRLGYFKVVVKEPAITIIGTDGEREIVDVDIIVDEGNRYWLKEVQFKNTATFPMAELRAAFPIGDGDLFNREKIATGLENLRSLYGTKGFVNFSAVPETTIDEAAHSISLAVDLDEGSIFHLGALTVRGVESEPGAREKLLNTWRSYQGRVYDYRLLPQFLKDLGARADVKPEQVFETSQDTNSRVVNVFITLAKPPLF